MDHLSLEAMHQLRGGKVALVVNDVLGAVLKDLHNRPHVTKPRKVIISLEITPISSDGVTLENFAVGVSADAKLPPMMLAPDILNVQIDGSGEVKGVMPNSFQPPLPGMPDKD